MMLYGADAQVARMSRHKVNNLAVDVQADFFKGISINCITHYGLLLKRLGGRSLNVKWCSFLTSGR